MMKLKEPGNRTASFGQNLIYMSRKEFAGGGSEVCSMSLFVCLCDDLSLHQNILILKILK